MSATTRKDVKAIQPLALTAAKDGPRIDSRVMAQSMGNTHRPTVALIDKYREPLERLDQVLFKKAVGERKQGGGKAERVALLTEDQALFLLALSRNTIPVAMLTAVNHVAALAMDGASDHHQGYERAKAALRTLQGLLAPPDKGPAVCLHLANGRADHGI